MSDKDYEALCELVSEFESAFEAVRFIRAEAGCGLRDAMYEVVRIRDRYPDSALSKATMSGIAA